MKWFLFPVFQLTTLVLGGGCYNTGPSIQEWDRTFGDERFSLREIKKNMDMPPVGACVLDGVFLLINKDINGTRRPVCLSGEPYVRGHHCVWNTDMVAAPFDLTPCVGECFEHSSCDWHYLFFREGGENRVAWPNLAMVNIAVKRAEIAFFHAFVVNRIAF